MYQSEHCWLDVKLASLGREVIWLGTLWLKWTRALLGDGCWGTELSQGIMRGGGGRPDGPASTTEKCQEI